MLGAVPKRQTQPRPQAGAKRGRLDVLPKAKQMTTSVTVTVSAWQCHALQLPPRTQASPHLFWGLLSAPRSLVWLCYTLPVGLCSLPHMCFVLPPAIKSWLANLLSTSEGAFNFPIRSQPSKHLRSSHFKDGNRRKHTLLCLENIISVFWLHEPAVIENTQAQMVRGGVKVQANILHPEPAAGAQSWSTVPGVPEVAFFS